MAVKFLSKQLLETNPSQFYKVGSWIGYYIVTVINDVIGGEDLKWLADITVILQVSNYNLLSDYNFADCTNNNNNNNWNFYSAFFMPIHMIKCALQFW